MAVAGSVHPRYRLDRGDPPCAMHVDCTCIPLSAHRPSRRAEAAGVDLCEVRHEEEVALVGPRTTGPHAVVVVSLSLVCVAARRRRRGREGRTGEASLTSPSSTLHYASSRLWWICWRPRRLGLVRLVEPPGGQWNDNWRHRNRFLHASEVGLSEPFICDVGCAEDVLVVLV